MKNGQPKGGLQINMIRSKIAGLSILEALVSTVIVGIGFVAILQMTNFSVQSIQTSGDRTKANYLLEMIAEDLVASKDTYVCKNNDDNCVSLSHDNSSIEFSRDGTINYVQNEGGGSQDPFLGFEEGGDNFLDQNDGASKTKTEVVTFSENLTDNSWSADLNCETSGDKKKAVPKNAKKSLYTNQNNDGPSNKKTKWSNIFDENRFLNCKSNNEIKKLEVFKICKWGGCKYKANNIYDDPMYIGRVELRINDGKKSKYLYFQSDYRLKE